jgi:hypothetical protein
LFARLKDMRAIAGAPIIAPANPANGIGAAGNIVGGHLVSR